MIALLLAQLVMPSPSVEPLSPPGMVCMGECSDGPMVWRASPARGRLVVACDMRSDTCSDGRRIVTERATPVPCEVAPGQWEMVPEDTGCYGVRGLESWAATTSYLSWGAELDRSPWTLVRGGTVEKLPDGWRVKNDPNQNHSGMSQVLTGAASGEVWTSAYILRTSNDVFFQLWAGSSQSCGGAFTLNTGGAWRQFSCSTVVPATPMAAIHPGSSVGSTPRPQYSVDVKAAWTVKADTPGRPCWGGEAPVTCAVDRHTISTEGWPTEAGEVEIVFVYSAEASRPARLIDSRLSSSDERYNVFISSLGGRLIVQVGSTNVVESGNLAWEDGRTYRVRVRRSAEGIMEVYRDGVLLAGEPAGAFEWGTSASLGVRYDGLQHLSSSIRSLTVRSYE